MALCPALIGPAMQAGCSGTGHAFVPITLGDQIQIGISVASIVGRKPILFPGDPGTYYGGFGETSYTLQVREGSTTGLVVAITELSGAGRICRARYADPGDSRTLA